MARGKKSISGASVAFATAGRRQTAKDIHIAIDRMLGRAGCENCGRLLRFDLDFLIDPAADLGRLGVTSVQERVG
jgi:hypothetical protein